MISVEKIRTLLKFDGVKVEFTDEELELLIESKIDELEGLVGIGIRPHDRQKTVGKFKGKILELNFYPVIQISEVIVNGFKLSNYDYYVNNELGILYFNHMIRGHVIVYYTSGLSERDFSYLIIPLIKDMVAYALTYNEGLKFDKGISGEGTITSLKEGDVSIGFGYDTNLSLGGRVYNRIGELRDRYNTFSTRVRWI